jgi:hypothetical protein
MGPLWTDSRTVPKAVATPPVRTVEPIWGWHRPRPDGSAGRRPSATITLVTAATRQVRAVFTTETITVYQAYPAEIAEPALLAGRFVQPFTRDRMTWIKPSFLWMMYRCGWAEKPGQERVLAVEMTRTGFEWALAHACLSHFDPIRYGSPEAWSRQLRASPVRVQWDPERSLQLTPLSYRSLQVGLSGEALDRYVDDWIVSIEDVTSRARTIRDLVRAGAEAAAAASLPAERVYPLAAEIGSVIGAAA